MTRKVTVRELRSILDECDPDHAIAFLVDAKADASFWEAWASPLGPIISIQTGVVAQDANIEWSEPDGAA